MAEFRCTVHWHRVDARFTDHRYSRAHQWRFDGGAVVRGSSSPQSVPVPYSDPAAVDPEEALAASVSSCHMLWFLSLAAQRGFVVDQYDDEATALMGDIGLHRKAITEVVLRPSIVFSGPLAPSAVDVDGLHHEAHERCYIANSLKSTVRVEGTWRIA